MSTTATHAAATRTVALVCSLDTKGEEARLVRDLIAERGLDVLTIDTGVVDEPPFTPEVPASDVARAGRSSLDELRK